MLADRVYMERHKQVAGIVYRTICAEYGVEAPWSKWEMSPKGDLVGLPDTDRHFFIFFIIYLVVTETKFHKFW